MPEKKPKPPTYLNKLLAFYFARRWESFFSIFYLIFFAYFSVFHSGKILIAFNFLFYTFFNSTLILTIDYLFWGVVFIIGLIIPFSVSLYAIILFYEIWKGHWKLSNKFLTVIAIILAVPLLSILMDSVTRISGNQPALIEFVQTNELRL